jgi:hypothetical protein
VAILKGDMPVKDVVDRINDAIIDLGYSTVMEIQEEVDNKGLELGHTYLQGPTPTTLRPRIIKQEHLSSLQEYSDNLWRDLKKLEKIWQTGKLNPFVTMSESEKEIARMQPWEGSPALVASDGLFSFGAHVENGAMEGENS